MDPACEAHFAQLVQDALAAHLHRNAVFLAERLHASCPTESNTHLLATAYLRSQKPQRAHAVLTGTTSPPCRYLRAVACLQLALLPEAETALLPQDGETSGGSAGRFMLGVICRRTNRPAQAVAHFKAALAADPFCWAAFEELCALGEERSATALLANADAAALYPALGNAVVDSEGYVTPGEAAPDSTLAGGRSVRSLAHTPQPMDTAQHGVLTQDAHTPAPFKGYFVTPSPAGVATAMAPPAAVKAAGAGRAMAPSTAEPPDSGAAGWALAASSYTDAGAAAVTPTTALRRKPAGPATRKVTGRLFSDMPAQSLRRSSRLSGAAQGLEVSPSPGIPHLHVRREEPVHAWGAPPGRGLSAEGGREALLLLRALGAGAAALSAFRCDEALAAFARLPPAQYRTGWVLCCVGRAHAEAVDYEAAERAFASARSMCPHWFEGMEYYSTVLWHRRRGAALALLAHEAVALDRLAPTTWCVVGNCLSLAREHEGALRAFGRATELDPNYAYAWTLAGHEHAAAEDWDAALRHYRAALAVDPRHYNAWYGCGAVAARQERPGEAEAAFRRALAIHPASSVLRACLGTALAAQGRSAEALVALDAAVAADARNPLARYERAALLLALDRPTEAAAELEALKGVAPREASVYLLLAKVHRRLNQPALAALCAGTAADLGGAAELGGKEEDETVHEG